MKHFFVLFGLLVSQLAIAQTGDVIIHPKLESSESRFNSIVELLDLAMSATKEEFGPYSIKGADRTMPESRSIHELETNTGTVSLIWSPANEKLESSLSPVRIPLYKGLLGYRLFLIHKGQQGKFDQVKTLDDLRALSCGQGQDWIDVKLLRHNKMKVITGSSYEGLFKMVVNGRFDYFSRGVHEVFPEHTKWSKELPNLAVEQSVLLYYPWPYYFYVSKKNDRLKKRITTGLEKLIANGTFDAWFNRHHGETIRLGKLKDRKRFDIENPFLTKKTPLKRKELWYSP